MTALNEYRAPELAAKLSAAIAERMGKRSFTIMEVCGGQTHVIHKYRLRDLLPSNLRLVSGPGCPVCVTPISYIDKAIALALEKGARVFTFGDLMRVPGTRASLERAAAEGGVVESVYSPFQAVAAAKEDPSREVVFLGIGFETTLPGVGLIIKRARNEGVNNFSVLLSAKRVPPVLDALLSSGETAIDGFITPGHVTSILGVAAYDALCARHRVPMAVGGFEPVDLLAAIHALAGELVVGGHANLNAYARAVSREGNRKAQAILAEVFEETDDELRGLGVIPNAGYRIRETFADFDADRKFNIHTDSHEPAGCVCGAILKGLLPPADCPLFGTSCTPDSPVGSCMVSAEGACNAAYLFQ